jgi:hypothetical protein
VPVRLQLSRKVDGRIWDTWTERAVRPRSVEVLGPLREDPAQMLLAQRNQKIEAFSSNRADRPLADPVRLRNADGRLENLQVQTPDGFVEPERELGISVADREAIRMISGDSFPELLPSPISRRMPRHIAVEDPPSRVFDDDEDVENLECRGYDREEVAGNDGRA